MHREGPIPTALLRDGSAITQFYAPALAWLRSPALEKRAFRNLGYRSDLYAPDG
jgi:hypothetical protein